MKVGSGKKPNKVHRIKNIKSISWHYRYVGYRAATLIGYTSVLNGNVSTVRHI